jgi:hypothetical protein
VIDGKIYLYRKAKERKRGEWDRTEPAMFRWSWLITDMTVQPMLLLVNISAWWHGRSSFVLLLSPGGEATTTTILDGSAAGNAGSTDAAAGRADDSPWEPLLRLRSEEGAPPLEFYQARRRGMDHPHHLLLIAFRLPPAAVASYFRVRLFPRPT